MADGKEGYGPHRPLAWYRQRLAELLEAGRAVDPCKRYTALPDLLAALEVVMLAGAENSGVALEKAMEAVREFEHKYDPPKKKMRRRR